jgi:AmiR/NasT family two-component response regulator
MTANHGLRIAVADDEPDMLMFFRELLPHLGHEVVAEAATGRDLVERCRGARPDLVITDVKMPDGDGLAAAAEVNRDGQVPVILVTAHHDGDVLAGTAADYIMSYLAKPVKPVDLQAAVHLAMLRFGHFQALAKEAADLRKALEDRKLIERAKGAVVKRVRVDEEEAFRRMRKRASDTNQKLVQVARQVAAAEELFRQLDVL